MKASRLWDQWPFSWPMRPHQREHMVHSRAVHPSTLTVLLPKLEQAAVPDCWCGRSAELLVLIHALDNCLGDNLSDDGCEILLSCVSCVRGTADVVAADLEKRLQLAQDGRPLWCLTCGRNIHSFHDLFSMEKL